MKYLSLLVLLVAGFESSAIAFDIPVPGPKAQPPTQAADESSVSKDGEASKLKPSEAIKKLDAPQRFYIHVDDKAKVAKLVIPNSVIRALQAEVGKSSSLTPGNVIADQPFASHIGTVVGGLLMALSVLIGGIWIARTRKINVPNFATIFLIVGLSSIGTASLVYANVGPPSEARSLTSKILTYGSASGEVQVETSNDSVLIELVLPYAK